MPSDDDGTDFRSSESASDDPLDVISSSQPQTDTMPSGDDGTDFKFEYSGSESDDLQEQRVSTPAAGASEKECLHALKQFQIETRRLESACRRFSATYGRVLVSSPKGGKEAMVKVKTKEYKEIALLGRKYAIMVEPWVDKHTFAPRPEGIDVSDPSNYESTWRVEQRRIEELHLFIPKTFHEGVAGSEDLRVKFIKGVNSERWHTACVLRKCTAKLFGIPPKLFTKGQHPDLERLLGPRTPDGNLSFKAPILFRNLEVADKDMFLNPVLPKILRVALFGSSSLDKKVRFIGPPTRATRWEVTAVTDGSIAWSSIMARWLCSPNKDFSKQWRSDFNKYKAILLRKRRRAPKRMTILLDWWNSEVFGVLDQANRPHTPFGDEDWHVESDSDKDGPGSCSIVSLVLSPDGNLDSSSITLETQSAGPQASAHSQPPRNDNLRTKRAAQK